MSHQGTNANLKEENEFNLLNCSKLIMFESGEVDACQDGCWLTPPTLKLKSEQRCEKLEHLIMNESESWIFTGVKVKRLHAELVAGFHATTEKKTCKAQKDMDSWVSFLATMFRGGKEPKESFCRRKRRFPHVWGCCHLFNSTPRPSLWKKIRRDKKLKYFVQIFRGNMKNIWLQTSLSS